MNSKSIAETLRAQQAAQATSAALVNDGQAKDQIPKELVQFIDVESSIAVESVKLDALAFMKIIKHSQEAANDVLSGQQFSASGQLFGIDLAGVLEVSNCFPLQYLSPPGRNDESDEQRRSKNSNRTRDNATLCRLMEQVNSDSTIVGVYIISQHGAHLTQQLLDHVPALLEMGRNKGFVLVQDATKSSSGNAGIKAYRLSPSFIAAHQAKRFDSQGLINTHLTFHNILTPVPIIISSSPLLAAYKSALTSQSTFPSLERNLVPSLTSGIESLMSKMDEYIHEAKDIGYQYKQQQWARTNAEPELLKRRVENAKRISEGLPILPEDDILRAHKVPAAPSRLDSTLLLGQLDSISAAVAETTATGLVKMYAGQSQVV